MGHDEDYPQAGRSQQPRVHAARNVIVKSLEYVTMKKKNFVARSPTHAPDVLPVSGSMPNINIILKQNILREKM